MAKPNRPVPSWLRGKTFKKGSSKASKAGSKSRPGRKPSGKKGKSY